jgi:hypothetical protein
MVKKKSSAALARRAAKNLREVPDSQTDFSDIPERSDEQMKRMRWVGRPATDWLGCEKPSVSRHVYRLEDLLKRITPRNLHRELDFGGPVGREAQ